MPALPPSQPAIGFRHHLARFFFWLGIALPLFTLVFESITHACAAEYFDPIPTWGHVALILLVPLTFLVVWLTEGSGSAIPRRLAFFLHGAALVSVVYYLLALGFLTPQAIFWLPFSILGGGLIMMLVVATLGPFSALFTWMVTRTMLQRLRPGDEPAGVQHWKRLRWAGVAAGLLAVALVEWPMVRTYRDLTAATASSASPETREAAITKLRRTGVDDFLLRLCYVSERDATAAAFGPLARMFHHGSSARLPIPTGSLRTETFDLGVLRDLYFRVTGRAYTEEPPPRPSQMGLRGDRLLGDDRWRGMQWDRDLGGDSVGATLRGLSLATSRMDWHLEKDSGLAYGEWTMEFHNAEGQAQEARCQILLPPLGCVSRLTLWVNGEPREAAFGSKQKVKEAYRQVAVVQRRDPVLVNMVGPDRIMVQCFPVPAQGTMKIRLGITAPVEGQAERRLVMPLFMERNFAVPAHLEHAVWLQANAAFEASQGPKPQEKDGTWASQEDMAQGDLAGLVVKLPDAPAPKSWAEDPFAQTGEGKFVLREAVPREPSPPGQVIVVIDASAQLGSASGPIREALKALARDYPITVFLSTDGKPRSVKAGDIDGAWNEELFQGGRDSGPALKEAWKLATSGPAPARILWLHGPQPLKFGDTEGLSQYLERSTARATIHAVSLVHGPNRLLEKLYRHAEIRSGGRWDGSAQGLTQLLQGICAGSNTSWRWTRVAEAPVDAPKVSDQLVRHGVFQEVLAAFRGQEAVPDEQTKRAVRYHLVTPYSGAVVLETQQQYAAAGLNPGDPNASPTIPVGVPEPSRAMLAVLGCAWLLLRRRR